MDEEIEEILSDLPERLTSRIESLDKPDEYREEIIREFYSEKEKFREEFGEELTEVFKSRIEDVCMDLAILRKKLRVKSEE